MTIYGTGLIAACLIAGTCVGRLLGIVLGIDANVGGVGIAMLLLITISNRLRVADKLPQPTANGILFWSSIYVPIVVAMAASQNVVAAVRGGPAAIVAGTGTVVACFAAVPLVSRIGRSKAGDDVPGNSATGSEE